MKTSPQDTYAKDGARPHFSRSTTSPMNAPRHPISGTELVIKGGARIVLIETAVVTRRRTRIGALHRDYTRPGKIRMRCERRALSQSSDHALSNLNPLGTGTRRIYMAWRALPFYAASTIAVLTSPG